MLLPKFNSSSTAVKPLFKFNQSFDINGNNEASLYNSISGEAEYLHGWDVVYLPREVNLEETVFGEYLSAAIRLGIPMRVILDEVEAWSGNGDMFTKIGLQVTDECTIQANITAWTEATSGLYYPKQGDLFYINKSQKLFQISHIENETKPGFYLFGNRTAYRITCKLFSYQHEEVNTSPDSGIPAAVQAIDNLMLDISGNTKTLDEKEMEYNNQNTRTQSAIVTNTTEVDPITGL